MTQAMTTRASLARRQAGDVGKIREPGSIRERMQALIVDGWVMCSSDQRGGSDHETGTCSDPH